MPNLLQEADDIAPKTRGSYNTNAYGNLILDENEEVLGIYLVDWDRALKTKEHFDKDQKKMVICNETYYEDDGKTRRVCEWCNSEDDRTSNYTVFKNFLFWNLSAEGTTRKTRDGEEYAVRPIQIHKARLGANGENFSFMMEKNGDKSNFYSDGSDLPDPKALKKDNALLFSENGNDRIWGIKKVAAGEGKKKKVSYPVIQPIELRDAQKRLDRKDQVIKVPDDIRDAFNKCTLMDLAPHYLANIGNVDWDQWGLEPPEEGSRIGDPPENDKESRPKSDSKSSKSKL